MSIDGQTRRSASDGQEPVHVTSALEFLKNCFIHRLLVSTKAVPTTVNEPLQQMRSCGEQLLGMSIALISKPPVMVAPPRPDLPTHLLKARASRVIESSIRNIWPLSAKRLAR